MNLPDRDVRYRDLVVSAGVGILVVDLDGVIVSANPSFHAMLGIPSGELVGRHWAELVEPAEMREASEAFAALRSGDRSQYSLLGRLRARSGANVWVSVVASTLRDTTGAPDSIVAFVTDATAEVARRTRMEAFIRLVRGVGRATDATTIVDALFAETLAAFEANTGAVCRWDEERNALVFVRLQPYTAAQLGTIPSGSAAIGRAFAEGRTIVVNDYQREGNVNPIARRDGYTAAIATPLVHDGIKLGAIAVGARDGRTMYGPEDEQTIELLASVAAAELAGVRLGRIDHVLRAARRAEHEMGTKLAMTVGYAELLANDPALSEEAREMAQEALAGALDAVAVLRRLEGVTDVDERLWEPGPEPGAEGEPRDN